MKVTDLMIVDWIEDDYKKAQVTSITCDGIVETTSAISNIEVIEPIPLTEEILAKNGYKSTQGLDFYWFDDKKHCCIKNYDGKRLFCYKQGINDVWLVVKYVHQLQHLLRLCGIEKEIEL